MAHGDGVDHIDDDGTVHLTAASHQAVAEIAPDLAHPIAIDDPAGGTARLRTRLTTSRRRRGGAGNQARATRMEPEPAATSWRAPGDRP
jgi:streptogramin lyase